jgi:hypothetical protein
MLMKCPSERTFVPFISLAVRRALWTLETMARQANIAYHALIFMLHGLYNKWKQPVAYYLMDGGAKSEMLVNFLMVEVLDASHNVILEVDWHYV